eukprot:gene10687-biopygen18324
MPSAVCSAAPRMTRAVCGVPSLRSFRGGGLPSMAALSPFPNSRHHMEPGRRCQALTRSSLTFCDSAADVRRPEQLSTSARQQFCDGPSSMCGRVRQVSLPVQPPPEPTPGRGVGSLWKRGSGGAARRAVPGLQLSRKIDNRYFHTGAGTGPAEGGWPGGGGPAARFQGPHSNRAGPPLLLPLRHKLRRGGGGRRRGGSGHARDG